MLCYWLCFFDRSLNGLALLSLMKINRIVTVIGLLIGLSRPIGLMLKYLQLNKVFHESYLLPFYLSKKIMRFRPTFTFTKLSSEPQYFEQIWRMWTLLPQLVFLLLDAPEARGSSKSVMGHQPVEDRHSDRPGREQRSVTVWWSSSQRTVHARVNAWWCCWYWLLQ